MRAGIGERLLRERQVEHVEELLEHGPRAGEVLAETFELVGLVAAADAEDEPPAGEAIDHADLGQQPRRLVERRDDDGRGEFYPLGLPGAARRHQQRRRADAVVGEVVLGEPRDLEAEPVGMPDLLHVFVEHPLRRRPAFAVAHEAEIPEMHSPLPRWVGASIARRKARGGRPVRAGAQYPPFGAYRGGASVAAFDAVSAARLRSAGVDPG